MTFEVLEILVVMQGVVAYRVILLRGRVDDG
jgi:hypothetical protein